MESNKAPVPIDINLTKPKRKAYYGTAGYRLSTDDLNNVVCRAAFMANIRSAAIGGKFIGLYITASHNPLAYNGLKFVDHNGGMPDKEWEEDSDRIVNCEDSEFAQLVNDIYKKSCESGAAELPLHGNLIIGRDSRDSGKILSRNVVKILSENQSNVFDFGLLTCPEIHFLVQKCNQLGKVVDPNLYTDAIFFHYRKLRNFTGSDFPIGLDTANGVGKKPIESICEHEPYFKIQVLDKLGGILNKACGAEYVYTAKKAPFLNKSSYELCASFDGDVDRLVFYTEEHEIFDGDAQAVFLADKFREALNMENVTGTIGVILSYYSNTGAINYLRRKGFEVILSETGVKNFVKEAEKYDIGIYFEPNGHGSVRFSKTFLELIQGPEPAARSRAYEESIKSAYEPSFLNCLTRMFNQCVGDALANLLIFKCLLKSKNDFKKYIQYSSYIIKIKIKDKTSLKVDSEYKVIEPPIQNEIEIRAKRHQGRAFVRPSGTENIIKVFAEALNEGVAYELALSIANLVYDKCKGVGRKPH